MERERERYETSKYYTLCRSSKQSLFVNLLIMRYIFLNKYVFMDWIINNNS